MEKEILIIEDSSKSYLGGGQTVSLLLIEVLREEGFEVILADHFTSSSRSPFEGKGIRLIKLKTAGKILASNKGAFSVSLFEALGLPYYSFLNILLLRSAMRRNINTVLCTTKKALLLGLLYKLLLSKRSKVYFYAHTSSPEVSINKLFWKLLSFFEFKTLAVSNYCAQSMNGINSNIIYNCVKSYSTSVTFQPQIDGKTRLGFVGNVTRWKGIEFFCELSTKPNMKNYEFHVIGTGDLFERLSERYNKQVVFHGRLPTNRIYDKIDILVLPSIGAESCPMVLIEALANGKPFLTTAHGGQAELAHLVGLPTFEKSCFESFNEALEALNRMRRDQKRITFPKKFTVENYKSQIKGVFS